MLHWRLNNKSQADHEKKTQEANKLESCVFLFLVL